MKNQHMKIQIEPGNQLTQCQFNMPLLLKRKVQKLE